MAKKDDANLHGGHRQRMMDRFKVNGLNGFSEHEILEIMLYFVFPRINTNELAHRLLNRFGSIRNILEADPKEIAQVEGFGPKSAEKIALLAELYRMVTSTRFYDCSMNSECDRCNYCRRLFTIAPTSRIYAIYLDEYNYVIDYISMRPKDLLYDIKGIMKIKEYSEKIECSRVVLTRCVKDSPCPDDDEIRTVQRIEKSLDNEGVKLFDYVIVNLTQYYSFKCNDHLNNEPPVDSEEIVRPEGARTSPNPGPHDFFKIVELEDGYYQFVKDE